MVTATMSASVGVINNARSFKTFDLNSARRFLASRRRLGEDFSIVRISVNDYFDLTYYQPPSDYFYFVVPSAEVPDFFEEVV